MRLEPTRVTIARIADPIEDRLLKDVIAEAVHRDERRRFHIDVRPEGVFITDDGLP